MSDRKKHGGSPFEVLRALKEELRREAESARSSGAVRSQPRPAAAGQTKVSEHREPVGTRSASDEDQALLFHRLFAGVTPLDRSRGRVPKLRGERSAAAPRLSVQPSAEAMRAEAEAIHERLRSLVDGASRFEVADDGRRVEGRRIDVPQELVRRLRRGRLPIDARLDLHGLGVREARSELDQFLRTTRARGERCVLVIHGKGEHSPQGSGVLRGEMAAWLSQGAQSEHVAAFVTAGDEDGGEGAVYVLLRR
jgi:DNA-nicking Smr family endonuclease